MKMSLFMLPWLIWDPIEIQTLQVSKQENQTRVLTSFLKVCEALNWYIIPSEINKI